MLAAVLLILPVGDVLTTVSRTTFDEPSFRYAFVGVVSNSIATILLALLLVLALSRVGAKLGLLLLTAATCIVAGGICLGFGGMFVLDSLQLSETVKERLPGIFLSRASWTFTKITLEGIALLVIGISGLRAVMRFRRELAQPVGKQGVGSLRVPSS